MSGEVTRVRIIAQTDAGGAVTGGIDSVIRGIAKWAPSDIEVSIVGLSSNVIERPIGQWTSVRMGSRAVAFLPVGWLGKAMQRSRIPYSVRLLAGTVRYRRKVLGDATIFDFHRVETSLSLLYGRRHRNLFVHQNMDVIGSAGSDIGWRYAPEAYFALERHAIPRFSQIYCVRSDAVGAYLSRFPALKERVHFFPTWMDPEIFYSSSPADRRDLRKAVAVELALPEECRWVIGVGRLDRQKSPLLMIQTFAELARLQPTSRLILVGDGPLRSEVESLIVRLQLGGKIVLTGAKPPEDVSRYLRASDVFLMTSAYEGMPISVLEAMASGLPVVSTRVGELPRVVVPGVNGILVDGEDPRQLADAVAGILATGGALEREASVRIAQEYVPAKVLAPLFNSYRAMARSGHACDNRDE